MLMCVCIITEVFLDLSNDGEVLHFKLPSKIFYVNLSELFTAEGIVYAF